jgi:hypothetical protein
LSKIFGDGDGDILIDIIMEDGDILIVADGDTITHEDGECIILGIYGTNFDLRGKR